MSSTFSNSKTSQSDQTPLSLSKPSFNYKSNHFPIQKKALQSLILAVCSIQQILLILYNKKNIIFFAIIFHPVWLIDLQVEVIKWNLFDKFLHRARKKGAGEGNFPPELTFSIHFMNVWVCVWMWINKALLLLKWYVNSLYTCITWEWCWKCIKVYMTRCVPGKSIIWKKVLRKYRRRSKCVVA